MLRRFHFDRKCDVSGVSGCGVVASGVMWDDGKVAIHWEGTHSSINIYNSIEDMIYIHGHNGSTTIVWDD